MANPISLRLNAREHLRYLQIRKRQEFQTSDDSTAPFGRDIHYEEQVKYQWDLANKIADETIFAVDH